MLLFPTFLTTFAITIYTTSKQGMNFEIYNGALCASLPLMLFFGFYFLFGKTPNKSIFANYLRSRRRIGVAMLLLSANYMVHLFYGIRFKDVEAAIVMNLATYFLCYWLFSSALTTLLNRFYITRKREALHAVLVVIFIGLSVFAIMCEPMSGVRLALIMIMASLLLLYGIVQSVRLMALYYRAERMFDNTHSDDIGAYIKWMSNFTYCILIYGVGCGLLTFLNDEYVFCWILTSIPLYVYLFCCYQNYLLFYEKVEMAFINELPEEKEEPFVDEPAEVVEGKNYRPDYTELAEKVNRWISANRYITPGLTIKDVADQLLTNRTYLSSFIGSRYGMSFRNWVTNLRLEYSKKLMTECPDKKITEISELSGFMSLSNYMKNFNEKEGCSPAKWRKSLRE